MLTSYPADRLHDKHPPPPASEPSRQPADQHSGGSILDADPPDQGVKIARRNTHQGDVARLEAMLRSGCLRAGRESHEDQSTQRDHQFPHHPISSTKVKPP